MRPIISEDIGPVFMKFSALVDKWMQIINLTFVLSSPQGRCYGNQFLEQTVENRCRLFCLELSYHRICSGQIFTIFAPYGRYWSADDQPNLLYWCSETKYRYVNMRVNSINDASTSCKNFVNFNPVTSEITGLIFKLLVSHGKNGLFSRISQNILHQFSENFQDW